MVDYVTTSEMARAAGAFMESAGRGHVTHEIKFFGGDAAVQPLIDTHGFEVVEFTARRDLPEPETLKRAISERNHWADAAARFSRNEDYYRGPVEQIGEMVGEDAYTADDGVVHDTVLCAKVPELVKDIIAAFDDGVFSQDDADESAAGVTHDGGSEDGLFGRLHVQFTDENDVRDVTYNPVVDRPTRFLGLRLAYHQFREDACLWLARRMPKRLRYWATIISGANASQGEWGHVDASLMLFMDVLKRNEVVP